MIYQLHRDQQDREKFDRGDKPALAPGNRWPGLQPDGSQLPEEDDDDSDEGEDEGYDGGGDEN